VHDECDHDRQDDEHESSATSGRENAGHEEGGHHDTERKAERQRPEEWQRHSQKGGEDERVLGGDNRAKEPVADETGMPGTGHEVHEEDELDDGERSEDGRPRDECTAEPRSESAGGHHGAGEHSERVEQRVAKESVIVGRSEGAEDGAVARDRARPDGYRDEKDPSQGGGGPLQKHEDRDQREQEREGVPQRNPEQTEACGERSANHEDRCRGDDRGRRHGPG